MGKQKQVNTNQLRAGLTKAYRLVQFARLCAGDVTVIAECLIEAGIEHEAATYVAEVMGGAEEDLQTVEDAIQYIRTVTCSNCGFKGHNRRTCRGWIIEVFGR